VTVAKEQRKSAKEARKVKQGEVKLTIGADSGDLGDELISAVKQLEVLPVTTLFLEGRDEDDGLLDVRGDPGDVGVSERILVELKVDLHAGLSGSKGDGLERVGDVADKGNRSNFGHQSRNEEIGQEEGRRLTEREQIQILLRWLRFRWLWKRSEDLSITQ
jgi:hypothetical protein